MDLKTLDKMAKQNKVMPGGLEGYEQAYYIAARSLYRQYEKGDLSLEQARQEKDQVVEKYKEGQWQWQYFMKLHELLDQLKALKASGFDTVLEFEIMEKIDELLR